MKFKDYCHLFGADEEVKIDKEELKVVLRKAIAKIKAADELADAAEEYSDHLHHTDCSFFKTRIQLNDCCDCGLNSLGLSLKAYRKAGESEGDE